MTKDQLVEKIITLNHTQKQSLKRTPEPDPVTDSEGSVADYVRVMETNLSANYSVALEHIFKCVDGELNSGLDLCCGPGHFTLALAKTLDLGKIDALDLSAPMIDHLKNVVSTNKMKNVVHPRVGDVTRCEGLRDSSYDVVTFTNSAHHLPSLNHVKQAVHQMERLAKPEALIFFSDLSRLKSTEMTELFCQLAGDDFLVKGMPHMYEDFKNSMNAAWLPSEIKSTIPENSKRTYYHMTPKEIPFLQFLIGLPEGRDELFVRDSTPKIAQQLIKNSAAEEDYKILTMLFAGAEIEKLPCKINLKSKMAS